MLKSAILSFVNKKNIIILFALLFYIIAGNLETKPLYLSFSFLASVIITSYLFSIYTKISLRKLSIVRKVQAEGEEEEQVEVTIILTNNSLFPQYGVEVVEYIETPYGEKIKNSIIVSKIASRSKHIEKYCFIPPIRGKYNFEKLIIKSSFPFGIISSSYYIKSKEEIKIFPKSIKLPNNFNLKGERINLDSNSKVIFGELSDFIGTRDYRIEDNIKMIHWPSSVRQGKLIVKEYDFTLSSNAIISIDLNKNSNIGKLKESTLEYGIKIVASIATHILTSSLSTLSFIGEGKKEYFLPEGGGRTQLQKLFSLLVDIKGDGDKPFEEVISDFSSKIAPYSTLFLIFPNINLKWENYVKPISNLRAKNVLIKTILIEDKNSFTIKTIKETDKLNIFPYVIFLKNRDFTKENLYAIK